MTLAVEAPLLGSVRVVVLSAATSPVLRGTPSEYRRFGISLVQRVDVMAALAEVVHQPESMLLVTSDAACPDLLSVLEVALAATTGAVLLGIDDRTDTRCISSAFDLGIRGTVRMPLNAERLAQALRAVPPRPVASDPIVVDRLVVSPHRGVVTWEGRWVDLPPRELAILTELARAFPAPALLDDLNRLVRSSSTRPHAAVRVAIADLRRRLAEVARCSGTEIIDNVYGVGYRLVG